MTLDTEEKWSSSRPPNSKNIQTKSVKTVSCWQGGACCPMGLNWEKMYKVPRRMRMIPSITSYQGKASQSRWSQYLEPAGPTTALQSGTSSTREGIGVGAGALCCWQGCEQCSRTGRCTSSFSKSKAQNYHLTQYFQFQLRPKRREKDMSTETLHTTVVHAAANKQIQLYDKDIIQP